MPIEIRELTIKAVVEKDAATADSFDFVDDDGADAAGRTHTGGAHVLMGDGSVHFLGEDGELVDLVAAGDAATEPDGEADLRIEDDDASAFHFDGRLLTAHDFTDEQAF